MNLYGFEFQIISIICTNMHTLLVQELTQNLNYSALLYYYINRLTTPSTNQQSINY